MADKTGDDSKAPAGSTHKREPAITFVDLRKLLPTPAPEPPFKDQSSLGQGDFVLLAMGTRRLGHIEAVADADSKSPRYFVRVLVHGRRWAERTARFHAQNLYPLPSAPVEALLGARTLPMPPALPRRESATAAAPHHDAGSIPGTSRPVASTEPQTAPPPMPPGEFSDLFSKVTFPGPFRRYQTMAIDAFDRARTSGRRRVYLVLPPGAGKTLVGLEIARRLGNRTLALGPNTAIQEQWIKQWGQYRPPSLQAGDSPDLEAPITALTYQAICNFDSHNPLLDQQIAELQVSVEGAHPVEADANPHHKADAARLRGHARVMIAEGGDHEKLLSILHPNGRKLIEQIKAGKQFTIILDECHHLLEMWGHLLRALVHELGDDVFLVGLTATPPSEMDAREAALYQELFGRADFEVPTPAVVKEGNLAPYQELAYLTEPLEHERAYIAGEKTRFEELLADMMRPDLGSVSFVEWLRSRIFDRRSKEGVQVGWPRFESDHPDLALAALRYCFANKIDIPDGARLGEAARREPTADDWVVLIGDYSTGHLRESADPRDLEAWEMMRRSLPSLGYALTRQGIRSYISPVDRVLLLSASKAIAAVGILSAEQQALGASLRALILCDYEVAGSDLVGALRGVLDAQAGSAALLLKTLVGDPATAGLDPILVTGQTVACSRATATSLIPWLAQAADDLRGRLDSTQLFNTAEPPPGLPRAVGKEASGWENVLDIKPSGGAWSPKQYLPLVTQFFEEGHSQCLVGTRGLLGEGWDAKSVNVLLDLTGVTTTTSVHQMRGRSLRLDPAIPRKVANNWDVVCVARDHPKGAADYDRFVRKHRNYFGITIAGEIESGVGHVDPRLSPFGPPHEDVVASVNSTVVERSGEREQIYDRWGIGKPYENLPIQTVRIRAARSLGLPSQRMLAGTPNSPSPRLIKTRAVGGVAAGAGAAIVGIAAGFGVIGVAAGLLIVAASAGSAAMSLRSYAKSFGPSSALEDLAAAVADALAATRLIDAQLGAGAVRVVSQPDGYYRCYLDGASLHDSDLFAACLDELMAPIESPRYIIPRYVVSPPRGIADDLALLIRRFGNPRIGAAVVYHNVPSVLAANRDRVAVFQAAWNKHVSSGTALFEGDPAAQAIIQLQRGEDPFAVTTQMRTLWE